ncbi:hypothetical protein ABIA45_007104 [Bradyrhizobium sp. USDA 336]
MWFKTASSGAHLWPELSAIGGQEETPKGLWLGAQDAQLPLTERREQFAALHSQVVWLDPPARNKLVDLRRAGRSRCTAADVDPVPIDLAGELNRACFILTIWSSLARNRLPDPRRPVLLRPYRHIRCDGIMAVDSTDS